MQDKAHHVVLVLGGYGFFGQRIAAALALDPGIKLIIGGRSLEKARAACAGLGLPTERAVALDANSSELAEVLRRRQVQTLIHTAGPFQAQDYRVARAAIAAGCHYVDLADGRDFVAGIGALDAEARARGVSVISGASSVPGLSSAVVARHAPEFSQLLELRIGIGSGARAPGLATMRGVFSYCGKPIRRWQDGAWTQTQGWMDLQRYPFPSPVGARWLGSCDVPDLALFPQRYPTLKTVTFHAGFAGALGHLTVWALAGLVRAGLLRSLVPLVKPLSVLSRWMEPLVSDKGGMFVDMRGLGKDGQPLRRCWHLVAAQNHGPQVPCGAAIALARKLGSGAPLPRGAMPCLGLVTVEEYLDTLKHLDVRALPA